MSSVNSIGTSAADLLAAIRQQLLAKTSTSSDAQKTSASNGGLDAIINEIESSTGGSNQTTGTSGSGLSSGVLSVLIVLQEQQGADSSASSQSGSSASDPGQQLFAALDANGDGQVSKSELESA